MPRFWAPAKTRTTMFRGHWRAVWGPTAQGPRLRGVALAGHPPPQLVSTLSALCLNCPTNMRVRTILSAVVIADTIYYAMISVLAIILWFSKNHPLGGWNSLCLNYLEKNTTYEPRTGRGRFARPVCLVAGRPFIAFDGPVSIFAMFVLMCIIFERKVWYLLIPIVCKVLRSSMWKISCT